MHGTVYIRYQGDKFDTNTKATFMPSARMFSKLEMICTLWAQGRGCNNP